jgi:hypothetical protein
MINHEVLPITTFGERVLIKTNNTLHTTLSNEFLLKRVLSIDLTPSPLNKTTLKQEIWKDISKPLRGLLNFNPNIDN